MYNRPGARRGKGMEGSLMNYSPRYILRLIVLYTILCDNIHYNIVYARLGMLVMTTNYWTLAVLTMAVTNLTTARYNVITTTSYYSGTVRRFANDNDFTQSHI